MHSERFVDNPKPTYRSAIRRAGENVVVEIDVSVKHGRVELRPAEPPAAAALPACSRMLDLHLMSWWMRAGNGVLMSQSELFRANCGW